jgi:hypothetical protein
VFVIVSWLLGSGCWSQLQPDPYLQNGSSYESVLLAEQGRRTLLALVTSTPDHHLVTVDPLTGERLIGVALSCATEGAHPTVYPPVGSKAWVRCGDREAYVLDVVTGAQEVSHQALVERHPDLSAGFRMSTSTVDPTVAAPIRRMRVTLHDGRSAYLDLRGELHFEPDPDQASWVPGYYCWPEHTCSRSRTECLGFSPSPSGVGYQLSTHRIHGESQREPELLGEWPVGLLVPGLVREVDSRCAFEREEHHLVLHDTAAFEPKNPQLSLVGRTGEVVWSVPYTALGADETHQPRRAIDRGDAIVVLVGNTRTREYLRAVTLDAPTGAVLGAHDLFGQPPGEG